MMTTHEYTAGSQGGGKERASAQITAGLLGVNL